MHDLATMESLHILLLSMHIQYVTSSLCINADHLIRKDARFDGSQFWSTSTRSFTSCVKACVRVKLCASFNYNLKTKVCELNTKSSSNIPGSVTAASGVMHSNFEGWPSEVRDQHDRNNKTDEPRHESSNNVAV